MYPLATRTAKMLTLILIHYSSSCPIGRDTLQEPELVTGNLLHFYVYLDH